MCRQPVHKQREWITDCLFSSIPLLWTQSYNVDIMFNVNGNSTFEYSERASVKARVDCERKVLELSVTSDAALLMRESRERFSTCLI